MKGSWILLLALLVLMAAAALLAIRGRGQRGGKRKPSVSSHTCYQAYVELEREKMRRLSVVKAFTGQAGITNRVQMLMGYQRDGSLTRQGDWTKKKAYVAGQLEAVREELGRVSRACGSVAMTKAQYVRSLNLETADAEWLLQLESQLKGQKQQLGQDKEYGRYEPLWKALVQLSWEAGRPDSFTGSLNRADSLPELAQALKGICQTLEESYQKAGLVFVDYQESGDDEKKQWFLSPSAAFGYPCVVEKEGRILINYGRVQSEQKPEDGEELM